MGQRTAAKGFVAAGAIREGEHVDEVGGGVSQFATTTFNAAYFAGLDIPDLPVPQRVLLPLPAGREATMGYPNPDLEFTNNTPYGIMIWTSYTDTQPDGDALLDAPRHRRADGHQRVDGRASAGS